MALRRPDNSRPTDPVDTEPTLAPRGGVAPAFIPLCVPCLRGREWRYLKECLDSGWVSSVGPFVGRFERMVAARLGLGHGIATVNGTAALLLALRVAGVVPDDEIIVSDLTFIAPANAVRYLGAWPVFIGPEPRHGLVDPERVRDYVEHECRWRNGCLHSAATGRRVRAIVPVHILGHPCDMEPILELCRKYDLVLVEDATEALGALYKGMPVGRLGDLACLSFNGNKLVTAGGGGMVVTSRDDWAARALYLATQAKDDPLEYEHREVGYNFRLTNLQAAVGVAQLERIDELLAAKRRIAARYAEGLRDLAGVSLLAEAPWAASACWMTTVIIDEAQAGIDSRALLRWLREAEIETRPLWQPMHRSRAHQDCRAYRCEVADDLHRRALSLPSSAGLSEQDQTRVIAAIRDAIRGTR